MRLLTTAALAAVIAGTIGAGALAYASEVASAAPTDTAATTQPATPGPRGMHRPGLQRGGMMGHMGDFGRWADRGPMRLNMLNMACGDRGAEALEIALVHVRYAVKPTAEQAPLLEALKTAALADQKTFADACKAAAANTADTGSKTVVDRLQIELALDKAKVTALTDLLPKVQAFYDSLTDQQKAQLQPRMMRYDQMGMNGRMGPGGWRHHRNGAGPADMMKPMENLNAPNAAPAPASDDAAPAIQG